MLIVQVMGLYRFVTGRLVTTSYKLPIMSLSNHSVISPQKILQSTQCTSQCIEGSLQS